DRFHVLHRVGNTRHSPPRDTSARSGMLCVRIEPKLEPADIESDIEGFVEVRVDAECFGVPLLSSREIRRGVNRGAQAEEMAWPGHAYCLIVIGRTNIAVATVTATTGESLTLLFIAIGAIAGILS